MVKVKDILAIIIFFLSVTAAQTKVIDLWQDGVPGSKYNPDYKAVTHYNQKVYEPIDTTSARPDFSILIYPVITMDSNITHMGSRINLLGKNPGPEIVKLYSNELQVNKNTPPAFLVQSIDDDVVPVQNSIVYTLALKKYNILCELHLYEKGGHGYGLGRIQGSTESSWPEACEKWLKMEITGN